MPQTLYLPVALTPDEHLALALEMSAVIKEAEAKEAEKKLTMSLLTEAVNALYSRIHDLNGPVSSGFVEREVEIREEPNSFSGKVQIFRVDTGAWVKDRDMDPDERQLRLGERAVPGPSNVRNLHATEEQIAAATPEEAEAMRAERLFDDAANAEIEGLAAEQAADAAKGSKKLLKSPKGKRGAKLVAEGFADDVRQVDSDGTDTTPPAGAAF